MSLVPAGSIATVVAARRSGMAAGGSPGAPCDRSGGPSGSDGVPCPAQWDGWRSAPYESRMMVTVRVYAYATGMFSAFQPAETCQRAGHVGLGVPGVERGVPAAASDHLQAGRLACRGPRPSGATGAPGAARPLLSARVCDSPQVTCTSDGPTASLPSIMTRPGESPAARDPGPRC